MGELRESIKRLLKKKPGLSDREITDEIRGRRALQQNVNQACRSLESQGVISREKREDGIIGNYLTGKNPLLYQRQKPKRPQLIEKECAFCEGKRIYPGSLDPFPPDCPACDGRGFNLIPEDWCQCIVCGGTGRKGPGGLLGDMYKPCPCCHGKGWADPRRFE